MILVFQIKIIYTKIISKIFGKVRFVHLYEQWSGLGSDFERKREKQLKFCKNEIVELRLTEEF